MFGNARADSSGAGLVVSTKNGCTITLRRADFRPDAAFSSYFGAEIRADDLKGFLPNWAHLAWIRTPQSAFYPAEVSARDGDYLVNIQAESNGENDVEALIEAFHSAMKEG